MQRRWQLRNNRLLLAHPPMVAAHEYFHRARVATQAT